MQLLGLAAASLPDFNPNQFGQISDNARFNRATKGLYEMGSTFKVLNTAIALETGATNINQKFEVTKPLRISRFIITDYKPRARPLNVPEIMVYSSNIGSARIAEKIGGKSLLSSEAMWHAMFPKEIPCGAGPGFYSEP